MNTRIEFGSSVPITLERAVKRIADKIRAVDNECGTGDGYWAYTRPGWCWDDPGLHTIHEYTVRDMLAAFGRIMPCDCQQCRISKAYEEKDQAAKAMNDIYGKEVVNQ